MHGHAHEIQARHGDHRTEHPWYGCVQPGEEKAGRDADDQSGEDSAHLLTKVGELVHGSRTIGAAEFLEWAPRYDLAMVIAGVRYEYDKLG